MICPDRFPRHGKIGLMTIGARPKTSYLRAGIRRLVKLGFQVAMQCDVLDKKSSDLWTDKDRLTSLKYCLSDPEIKLILATRGGNGTLRILDKINYEIFKHTRKIIVGFSDITALSLAIYKKTKLITFSGPMAAIQFPDPLPRLTKDSFFNNIHGVYGEGHQLDLKGLGGHVLVQGKAEGVLLGGNMYTLAKLLGTPFQPNFKGAILFVEDINESEGRVDNLFAQMRLAGILNEINGLMVGQFNECFKGSKKKRDQTLYKILDDYCGKLKIPVVCNLPFGHVDRTLTLPIGLSVQLNTRTQKLTYLESPVK